MVISPFPSAKKSFKFSVETTGSDETFTLPLLSGTHDFLVNWGDGSAISTVTSYDDANRIHTYTSPGTYVISMWGTCTHFAFNNVGDKLKLKQLLDFVDMGFISLDFSGCSNLISISNNMQRLKTLTSIEGMFTACSSLTTIPVDIFKGLTNLTTCRYSFQSCTGLISIPENLFKYNILVTDFGTTFYNCTGLTTIPEGLFKYNTAATSFWATFADCNTLATLPSNLFKYNVLATDFHQLCQGCVKLQLNENIFWGVGERDTRFHDQSINFDKCFQRFSFSGTQGIAPDLWNCDFGIGTPTTTDCFDGVGNSLTSISNYNDITEAWL